MKQKIKNKLSDLAIFMNNNSVKQDFILKLGLDILVTE